VSGAAPTVSVVITCFDQEDVIEGAVRSVLDQEGLDLVDEVVIVDDGSTDGSPEVLRRLADAHPLVRVVTQANAMVSAARNTGIAATSGSHVALLDGDDRWRPGRLVALGDALDQHPDVALHYCGFVVRVGDGTTFRPHVRIFRPGEADVARTMFLENASIIPSAAVISRTALQEAGPFDPEMAYNEEADMWFRLALVGDLCGDPRRLVEKVETADSMGGDPERRSRAQERFTDKALQRAPWLVPDRPAREALLAYKRGVAELRRGRRAEARAWLRRAVATPSAVRRRAAVQLALAHLPGPVGTLTRRIRSTRERVRPASLRRLGPRRPERP